MWQTERAALEAQLSGATAELAAAQTEAKAAREEATGLGSQLEAAEKAKVWPISLSSLSVMLLQRLGVALFATLQRRSPRWLSLGRRARLIGGAAAWSGTCSSAQAGHAFADPD